MKVKDLISALSLMPGDVDVGVVTYSNDLRDDDPYWVEYTKLYRSPDHGDMVVLGCP